MRVETTKRADKDLLSLDAATRKRILTALRGLQEQTGFSDIKKIKAQTDRWRLRVGDWRVILKIDQAEGVIYVLAIKHRSEAYR